MSRLWLLVLLAILVLLGVVFAHVQQLDAIEGDRYDPWGLYPAPPQDTEREEAP
jgi:hypothetical protein